MHWYPFFFANKRFHGRFEFRDTHTLVRYTLRELGPSEALVAPSAGAAAAAAARAPAASL